MTPKDYIKNVLITETRDFSPLQERFSQVRNIRLLHGAIGLASELAEIREMDQKAEIDEVNLKEEMGDLLWYMGIMIDELKLDPESVFYRDSYLGNSHDDRAALRSAIDYMTILIGTIIDLLKKSIMYGKELNVVVIADKLHSLSNNINTALELYGFTAAEARERNIEKLRARYGQKFTEAAALERNLVVEREILEKK